MPKKISQCRVRKKKLGNGIYDTKKIGKRRLARRAIRDPAKLQFPSRNPPNFARRAVLGCI
jgi:hypothetical protein